MATQGFLVIVIVRLCVIGLNELRKNPKPSIATVSVLLPGDSPHTDLDSNKDHLCRNLTSQKPDCPTPCHLCYLCHPCKEPGWSCDKEPSFQSHFLAVPLGRQGLSHFLTVNRCPREIGLEEGGGGGRALFAQRVAAQASRMQSLMEQERRRQVCEPVTLHLWSGSLWDGAIYT